MAGGLFPVENPYNKVTQMMSNATAAAAAQRPDQKSETEFEKTVGSGIAATGMGAAAGASLGASVAGGASTGSSAGWWGAGIGAVVGALSYFLS